MTAAAIDRHFIEDLKVGQSASYSRKITAKDIALFGEVSGDMNPLHFDEEYAKGTIFKGRIAHGMLSVSFLSTVLGTKLRIGDTVIATCQVREIDMAKGRVTFDCLCKAGDVVVIEGEAMLKVPSRADQDKG